jgi:bifunctional non-homologous end joining protein LigD
MTTLTTYRKKRDFKQTREPSGKKNKTTQFRFVVQRHQASHLHYDFRLELGGVLKSWAVPKGPTLNPSQKRLAVMVEDHPVDYITFKGRIPEGNYGAGIVEIWDHGTFIPVNEKEEPISERMALQSIKKGEIKFQLKGKKLKGGFVLVKLKNDEKNWLLIKHKDEYAGEQNIRCGRKPEWHFTKNKWYFSKNNSIYPVWKRGKSCMTLLNPCWLAFPKQHLMIRIGSMK